MSDYDHTERFISGRPNTYIFHYLPNELKLQIGEKLGFGDLRSLARTTRAMYQLLNHPLYRLAIRDHPTRHYFRAIGTGNLSDVKYFLETGASLSEKGEGGWTALHTSAFFGQDAICQLLINKGADIEAVDNLGGTPLHKATHSDSTSAVRCLLNASANVHAVDKRGCTPLHTAASDGCAGTVKALLVAGANRSVNDKYGRTPFECAILFRRPAFIKSLLEEGPNISTADN